MDATKNIQKFTLTQNLTGVTVIKNFTVYPNGHYDLEINSTSKEQFFITNGFRPNILADMYADHGVYVKLADSTMELTTDGDLDKTKSYTGAKFISEHATKKIVKVDIKKNDDGTAKATITTTTTENGKEVTKDEVIEGTLEEVKAKINTFETQAGKLHVDIKKDGEFTSEKNIDKKVRVKMIKNEDGKAKATITTTTTKNGKEVTDEEVIEGTLEEVKAKLKDIEGVEIKVKHKN